MYKVQIQIRLRIRNKNTTHAHRGVCVRASVWRHRAPNRKREFAVQETAETAVCQSGLQFVIMLSGSLGTSSYIRSMWECGLMPFIRVASDMEDLEGWMDHLDG